MTVTTDRPASNAPDAAAHAGAARLAPASAPHSSRGKVKLAPLAYWTEADVNAYIEHHNVPANPLIKDGYASVGCWPCTRRTAPGEDPRAGRWAMFDKTECGLHAA